MPNEIEIRKKQKDLLERLKKDAEEVGKRGTSKAPVGQQPGRTNINPINSVKLDFKCSSIGRGWVVILERQNENCLYKIKNTFVKTSTPTTGSGTTSSLASIDVDFDQIEDWTRIKCPCCGNGTLVRCGCGKVSCQGGVIQQNGRLHFKCPWCGGGGIIEGSFRTLNGEKEENVKKIEAQSGPHSSSRSNFSKLGDPNPHKALPP